MNSTKYQAKTKVLFGPCDNVAVENGLQLESGMKLSAIICEQCHRTAVPTGPKQRFCSRACSYSAKSQPIGTEVVWTKNGYTDIWVKVGKDKGTIDGWKRKAVIILESMTGRELKRGDKIAFVDGNRLNCIPQNIVLPKGAYLHTCKQCKRLAIRYRAGTTGMCHLCRTKGWADGTAQHPYNKLTQKEASLVKSILLALDGYGTHTKIARWFSVHRETISHISKNTTVSYKGARPMATNRVWKALLEQHDKLAKQTTGTLFDRVEILAQVYADPHFIEAMRKGKKSPSEFLDKRLSDTCANFTELLQILKMFPKRKQWEDGDLSVMRMKMLDSLRSKQAKKKKPKNGRHNRKSATIAELRELQEENGRLKEQLKMANDTIRSLQTQLDNAHKQLENTNVTIGSLNEAISLNKLREQKKSPKRTRDKVVTIQ